MDLWTIMYLTVPVQSMMKVALAGAPQSLATPMLMEREKSLSVKIEKPTGPPNPPRETSLLIHLLTARELSLATPTVVLSKLFNMFIENENLGGVYLEVHGEEEEHKVVVLELSLHVSMILLETVSNCMLDDKGEFTIFAKYE